LSFVLLRYLVRLILDNHLCNIVQVATGHIYMATKYSNFA